MVTLQMFCLKPNNDSKPCQQYLLQKFYIYFHEFWDHLFSFYCASNAGANIIFSKTWNLKIKTLMIIKDEAVTILQYN
jgi:hypothetical protein